MSLDAIVREAYRRTGRSVAKTTPTSVREALDRMRFVVRCGRAMYGPARVVLDQKALRLTLSPSARERARLPRLQLEPFYTVLGRPPLETEDGRPLEPIYLSEERTPGLRNELVAALRQERLQFSPWGWLARDLPAEEVVKRGNLRRVDTGCFDVTPVLSGFRLEQAVDLIVRWQGNRGALVVTARPRSQDNPDRIRLEDRLLANYLASKLVDGYAVTVGPLVLEAYAQIKELGRNPGSAVMDVIRADSRFRTTGDEAYGLQWVHVAHANRLLHRERQTREGRAAASDRWFEEWRNSVRFRIAYHPVHFRWAWEEAAAELGLPGQAQRRLAKVRLLHRPSHDQLIREWQAELEQRGLSERLQKRKVDHVRIFARYLESDEGGRPGHLLEVTLKDMETFFCWTYIRRWVRAKTDPAAFTLDLRDFYRRQQELGRIHDVRFVELIYRVREMIVERLELYNSIAPYDEDFPELAEQLFFGWQPTT